jgi:hypothetical protein
LNNKYLILFGFIWILIFITCQSNAQSNSSSFSNLVTKKLAVQDTIVIDTNSIEMETFWIEAIEKETYAIFPYQSLLVWKTKPYIDSITIHYRKLTFGLANNYAHKKTKNLSTYLGRNNESFYEMDATKTNTIVDFGNLDYAGSLSRGINFGNSQDVVVNSQFNLQLNGMLGDSIEMMASITDNNIPFQPEGNTQNLQEFDRVFIQFKKKNAKFIIGDHDLYRPKSYFMNFYKRVQGFYFSNENQITKKVNYKYGAGASLAKGKFVRTQIATIEGNQGPYKIIGPNGESFFIILANSEKLYIDGVLLTRGEDKDYIIDYNQAEIIFMPRKMITKDTRLIVEYEINERNYLNSLLYTTHELQIGKKITIYANGYSNQDAKKQTIQQTLDAKQELLLSNIGDDISKAIYPSYKLDTFNTNRVMYKLIDSTVNGITYDSIFIFSNNKDSANFTMGFSLIGANKGDYITSSNLKNGRVYSWIAPINGIPQGDYIPFIVLVTPKRQQLFSIATNYKISENKELNYEIGISNNDANLFSKIDNNTHVGISQKIDYSEKRTLSKKINWQMNNNLHLEYIQQQFKPLERFRDAEFTRDWTIDFNPIAKNELLAAAKLELYNRNNTRISYEFGTFQRGNIYSGIKHSFTNTIQKKTWRYHFIGNIIQSKFNSFNSEYIRPSFEINKTFSKLQNMQIGIKCSLENNVIAKTNTDSISKNSFAFQVAQLSITNNNESKNKWSAIYFTRRDALPNDTKLINAIQSHNLNITSNINSLKNQSINITSTYRKLFVLDTILYKLRAEDNLLGRLDYNLHALRNSIAYNVLYEFGSGQELKREFTYVEVPIGQGTHYWIDYNNNAIPELNEFEIAQFTDQKKFIKIFTPTNQYVGAKYNTFNQTIQINMKQMMGNKNNVGIKKLVSLFVLQSSMQVANKYISESGIAQYNPFYKSNNDANLISNSTSISNTIFFNRFGNVWGLDYIQACNNNRTLLTYGIDDRGTNEQNIRLRINVSKQIAFNNTAKIGNKFFNSAFLNNRSYNYLFKSLDPSIAYNTNNNNARIIVNYKYESRNNKIVLGDEKALIHAIGAEYKNTLKNSGNLLLKASYNNIIFDGEANSSVGFIMLDGLQNGKNFLWQANFDKRLAKGIEISFTYEGRKAGEQEIVHTGRANVRAIF